MKFIKKTYFIIAVFFSAVLFNPHMAFAAEYDPGSGRLSGDSISSDFYDSDPVDSDIYLNQYGTTKKKSPYTNVKYTHQSRFDDRTIVHGIDISKWQGEINWKKVKADGIDYAFIQVGFRGYGSSGVLNEDTKDPYFDSNMKNAIAAGIKVGVYVFSQATTEKEAIEEAEYILDAIGNYPISMPLVLDYEYASTPSGLDGRLYRAKLSKKKATNVCMAFCKEIAESGFTPMVYANKSMLEDQLNAEQLTKAGYRIWLANYTKNTSYSGTFDFWQYSEKGKVNGINGDVDMNYYYAKANEDFAPAPNSISSSVFTEVPNHIYTGQPIVPKMTVTKNGVPLVPNVDYTITYSDNTEIGTATITITGIGTYCNTRKIRFDIIPEASTTLQTKKRAKNAITLSWKKVPGVTGYEIYRATEENGTYSKVKTINKKSTVTYKDTKLSAGTCYYYKLRSYKKSGTNYIYSDFTPVQSIYTKTGYTRNAVAKSKLPIYDFIPGTKTVTVTTTPEPDSSTENNSDTSNSDASTENSSDANNSDTSSENNSDANNSDTSPENNSDTSNNTTSSENNSDNGSNESSTENNSDNDNNATSSENGSGNGSSEPSTENNSDTGNSETSTENNSDNGNNETTAGNDSTQEPNASADSSLTADTNTVPETITTTVPVESATLVTVSKKTTLNVIYSTTHEQKTWYYVSYSDENATYRGFVSGDKVTIQKLGKVVKTKQVNVRKKSSAYSKKITTLKKNSKVTILSTKKVLGATWYKVSFKKKNKTYKGWISANYIKLI